MLVVRGGARFPAPGPIIIQTVRQPPITQEITMGDVVLGAVGFVGAVMIAASVAGLVIGIVVVMIKRSRDAAAGPTDPGHAKLAPDTPRPRQTARVLHRAETKPDSRIVSRVLFLASRGLSVESYRSGLSIDPL